MTYVMLVVATTPTEKQGALFYTKFGRSDKFTPEMLQFLTENKHHDFWDMSDAARGFLAGEYAEDENQDSDEYKRGLALGREFWVEEIDDIPRFPPMPVIETWGLIINNDV